MTVTRDLRRCVALLRGINVGGNTRLPMQPLRELCEELGWREVQSYIQSGNVVFSADATAPELEAELEQGVKRRFGLSVPAIVRGGADWIAFVAGNPFPGESAREPNLVMLALAKSPPKADAEGALRERATNGEQIVRVGDALWIHFAGGAGRSRISPGLLDRAVGSPVTTRNWRTVLKLDEMLATRGNSSARS